MRRLPAIPNAVVLCYRTTDYGWPQLNLDPLPENLVITTGRLVLLIHGFNVSQEQAFDTYETFRRAQQDVAQLPREGSVSYDRMFIEVDWPGNIDGRAVISAAAYGLTVPRAQDVGKWLAADINYAARRFGRVEIEVVAHSLGCRVALEAIRHLDPAVAPIRAIVFQAAAVDVRQLESELDKLALRSALGTRRAVSLYSGWDDVLWGAFPPGQVSAGEWGSGWPKALGSSKWTHPRAPQTLTQHEIPRAGHSDYWGKPGRPERVRLAQYAVRDALAFQPPPPRQTPQRETESRPTFGERLTAVRKTLLG